jgi:hypothetical protein
MSRSPSNNKRESLILSSDAVFDEVVFLGSPPGGKLFGAKIKSENSIVWCCGRGPVDCDVMREGGDGLDASVVVPGW